MILNDIDVFSAEEYVRTADLFMWMIGDELLFTLECLKNVLCGSCMWDMLANLLEGFHPRKKKCPLSEHCVT